MLVEFSAAIELVDLKCIIHRSLVELALSLNLDVMNSGQCGIEIFDAITIERFREKCWRKFYRQVGRIDRGKGLFQPRRLVKGPDGHTTHPIDQSIGVF